MRLSVADRSSWATQSLFPYSFFTPMHDVAIIFSPMSQKDMPISLASLCAFSPMAGSESPLQQP